MRSPRRAERVRSASRLLRGKKRRVVRSDDGAGVDRGVHALAPDEVAASQQPEDALSDPAPMHPIDAVLNERQRERQSYRGRGLKPDRARIRRS